MEFDKSKILTCVTADQAKIGQKGWFSDDVQDLERKVGTQQAEELYDVEPKDCTFRFTKDRSVSFALFYPAPKTKYRPFNAEELCTLVGKVVTNRLTGYPNLVTGVTNSGKSVFVGTSCVSASVLMDKFTLNSEPCGMKEEA